MTQRIYWLYKKWGLLFMGRSGDSGVDIFCHPSTAACGLHPRHTGMPELWLVTCLQVQGLLASLGRPVTVQFAGV